MDYFERKQRIYDGYGVPTDYHGPLAVEFREYVERQMRRGMTGCHISRGPEWSVPGVVREMLAIDWAVRHGCTASMRTSLLGRLSCLKMKIASATIGRFNPYRATE